MFLTFSKLKDGDGNTALHLCQSGRAAAHLTDLFLKGGADVHMQNKKKYEKYQTVYFWFVDVDYLNKDFKKKV